MKVPSKEMFDKVVADVRNDESGTEFRDEIDSLAIFNPDILELCSLGDAESIILGIRIGVHVGLLLAEAQAKQDSEKGEAA